MRYRCTRASIVNRDAYLRLSSDAAVSQVLYRCDAYLYIFIRLTSEIYAVSKSSFEQLKGANRYLFSVSSAKERTTKPGIISISKAKLVKIDQKSVCI